MSEARTLEPPFIGPASEKASSKPRPRGRVKRVAVAAAILAATVGATKYGYGYWTTGRYIVSTNDAYVQADYTTIAPKISGYIDRVSVEDNQVVKAGQILARIDDRDFRTARDQAQSDVSASMAAIRNIEAEIDLQHSVVAQAEATVTADKATLGFAKVDADRYRQLAKSGAGSLQRAQQTEAANKEAQAGLVRDRAGLTAAQVRIAVLSTELEKGKAQLDHARAVLAQAELNLGYTVIAAPVGGAVGARTLRVGAYVAAGTPLMAIVPLKAVFVVANFKETQLTDVRQGQPVDISVDSFPDRSFKGRVDSLSPASGLEFSLLPPDNATGNFTKIVQRIPVKVMLDDYGGGDLLRPGMSVEASVDTKATAVAMRKRPDTATSEAMESPAGWLSAFSSHLPSSLLAWVFPRSAG
ncbi:MAG TPA: HlyD family secretion protein [Roseiarcus sp.]|nr:HlyD family secretion protein [Roseiarcus sp.]